MRIWTVCFGMRICKRRDKMFYIFSVNLSIGYIVVSVLSLFIGWFLSEVFKRGRKKSDTSFVNDDRVKLNIRTFLMGIFFFTNLILLIVLFVMKYFLGYHHFVIGYVLIYLIVMFFIAIIGGQHVLRR